jgi:hypothetical protein
MKRILIIPLLLLTQQAFACINVPNAVICNGDIVFKGPSYSQGAIIVGENPYAQQVTVQSKSTGSLYTEDIRALDVTRGCYGQFCVGSNVLKGASYSAGATIIGINYFAQTFTVKSASTGSLYVEQPYDLDATTGCLGDICVGEKIYKGTNYSQGATVIGENISKNTLTVKSASTNSLYVENLTDVDVTKGCLGSVCVNDRVFKGTSYSQGATVLAINAAGYRATVRSISTGSLYSESIYDLSSGSYPQPQPIPQPVPPRPVPGPGPVPPRPAPVTEQCTISRFDPAGIFIMSYTRTATGYPGPDLKAEACRQATNACMAEIRGRQTCR